jgi:hypothetical protein
MDCETPDALLPCAGEIDFEAIKLRVLQHLQELLLDPSSTHFDMAILKKILSDWSINYRLGIESVGQVPLIALGRNVSLEQIASVHRGGVELNSRYIPETVAIQPSLPNAAHPIVYSQYFLALQRLVLEQSKEGSVFNYGALHMCTPGMEDPIPIAYVKYSFEDDKDGNPLPVFEDLHISLLNEALSIDDPSLILEKVFLVRWYLNTLMDIVHPNHPLGINLPGKNASGLADKIFMGDWNGIIDNLLSEIDRDYFSTRLNDLQIKFPELFKFGCYKVPNSSETIYKYVFTLHESNVTEEEIKEYIATVSYNRNNLFQKLMGKFNKLKRQAMGILDNLPEYAQARSGIEQKNIVMAEELLMGARRFL